jgi:16S rRNA (uracil1498-N3)-methyltransferase
VLPRFFVAELDARSGRATLSREESHHLRHVMRLAPGADVHVFDGRGGEWEARVATIDRDGVSVDLGARVAAAVEGVARILLAQAVLKGDRMDAIVRDATMMGAAVVQPMRTAHTAVPARSLGGNTAERWRRIAIASAKQCGRAVVPEVRPVAAFADVVSGTAAGARVLMTEPRAGAVAVARVDTLRDVARERGAIVAIGPEGGWSADEIAAAVDAGFTCWSLGSMTLRADAMAVAALAVLRYAWER